MQSLKNILSESFDEYIINESINDIDLIKHIDKKYFVALSVIGKWGKLEKYLGFISTEISGFPTNVNEWKNFGEILSKKFKKYAGRDGVFTIIAYDSRKDRFEKEIAVYDKDGKCINLRYKWDDGFVNPYVSDIPSEV